MPVVGNNKIYCRRCNHEVVYNRGVRRYLTVIFQNILEVYNAQKPIDAFVIEALCEKCSNDFERIMDENGFRFINLAE